MKIFLIEDDDLIAMAVCRHLESWGYETLRCTNYRNIMPDFCRFDPHLVLLDISLPYYNGYHWCGEIRKEHKTPIIFISSASDSLNILTAISMGGDDFVSKPFDLPVLTAKIQALLRRTYDFGNQETVIHHNGVTLSLANAVLSFEDKTLALTKNDFRILATLLENHGKIISRDMLMQRLWETDSFIDENTLTVNVTRLRKKLEDIGLFGLIVTKKGLGYIIP